MRTLPSISIKGHSIGLPCAAESIAQLVLKLSDAGRQQDETQSFESIKSLLSIEPSLLIFLSHHYQQQNNLPAESLESLTRFAIARFAELFEEMPDGWSKQISIDPKPVRVAHREFCQTIAGSNSKNSNCPAKILRRGLRRFVGSISEARKKRVKRWIKQIIGDDIASDVIVSFSESHDSDAPTVSLDIERLVEVLHEHGRLQAEFDERLLREKLLSMKQLAYGASHEINNPLANIATRAQTMMADEKNPVRHHRLAVIYDQAMRAHEMISDMMLFAHPPLPNFASTDLFDLCKTVVSELRPQLGQQTIRARVCLYPGVANVVCDAAQIADSIKAVVRNSIEAIGSEGQIELRVWPKTTDRMAISVTDDGAGISKQAEQHLFDPYYSGREAGRGLGFGLSKAWTIVERLHHGELRIVPRDDGRTELEIQLPLDASDSGCGDENPVTIKMDPHSQAA